MSFVFATPEAVATAATDLANIASTIGAANAAAIAPTTRLPAAGADEISAAIAALFGEHALGYQA
jgi:PE family